MPFFLWLIWPWRIRGETWYEIRPPRWLRFRTSQFAETWLVFPAVALGCLAAIPGLLPYVIDLASSTTPGARIGAAQ